MHFNLFFKKEFQKCPFWWLFPTFFLLSPLLSVLSKRNLQWTENEGLCARQVQGEVQFYTPDNFSKGRNRVRSYSNPCANSYCKTKEKKI